MNTYDLQWLKQNKPLVIITGPTASGKTASSVRLAQEINGEIISADSMQVYKGMDIGTAKITKEEMEDVPHHLIDICNPEEEFNITIFQKLAKKEIEEIYDRGHIPIIAGGTGFYIQSVLYDVDFTDEQDNSVRTELERFLKENGADALFNELRLIDPESAEIIHKNNTKRVIRAIEFYRMNGYKISSHNSEQHEKQSPYKFRYFVLNRDRAELYERIEKRVDIMMNQGLLQEVQSLYEKGYNKEFVSMQGLGYKEIIDYLMQNCSLEDAVAKIKLETRHFAKRQLTWFRREKEVTWIDVDGLTTEDIVETMLLDLNKTILERH